MTIKKKFPEIIVLVLTLMVLSAILTIIGYKTFYSLDQTVDWNALTAIVAVFIGICALGVSLWQGLETRKNYILSVTPAIKIIGDWREESEYPGIYIQNKGIGPAIIKEFEIRYLEKKYNYLSEDEELIKVIGQGVHQVDITQFQWRTFDSDEYIAAGEITPVIFLGKSYIEKIDVFKKVLSGMKINLNYASVYGDSFSEYFSLDIK